MFAYNINYELGGGKKKKATENRRVSFFLSYNKRRLVIDTRTAGEILFFLTRHSNFNFWGRGSTFTTLLVRRVRLRNRTSETRKLIFYRFNHFYDLRSFAGAQTPAHLFVQRRFVWNYEILQWRLSPLTAIRLTGWTDVNELGWTKPIGDIVRSVIYSFGPLGKQYY